MGTSCVDCLRAGRRQALVDQPVVDNGIRLEVVKLPAVKRGFVLLPRRWVVERRLAWVGRFRRLAREDERLATTPSRISCVAFALQALAKVMRLLGVM